MQFGFGKHSINIVRNVCNNFRINMANLLVTPKTSLVDEKVKVIISGLAPNAAGKCKYHVPFVM